MADIKRVILLRNDHTLMKNYSLVFACLFTLVAGAQEKLVVMGKSPDQYVIHTVNGEASLQSISNQFGQSVTKLSTYNGLNATAVLANGTQIKIPLTQYNLVRIKGDNSAPVYHIVQKGDNLYRLSKANNVSLAVLKGWNGMKTDIVKDGQALIIGYMVNAKITETKKLSDVHPKVPDLNENESSTVTAAKLSKKNTDREETVTILSKKRKQAAEKEKLLFTPPVSEPIKKDEPVYVPKEGDEGYFAVLYSAHTKEQSQQFHSGDAAIFKTISGWTDHKYYVLINDIAPETIVRVTSPGNKSICAKVLGPLQETKGGSGLLLRMSNSAASALGITDTRVTVTVTYFQ